MSLEELEVNVGGTRIKGLWLAVIISFTTSIGGGIWGASEFFSRLEALESNVEEATLEAELVTARFEDFREAWSEEKKRVESDVAVVRQQLDDNDISGLQGKLAQLGTNLQTIMERQGELLTLQKEVNDLEQSITEMQVVVQKAETATANANSISETLTRQQKEIDSLWEGLDYLSNPYGN